MHPENNRLASSSSSSILVFFLFQRQPHELMTIKLRLVAKVKCLMYEKQTKMEISSTRWFSIFFY